MKFFVISDNTDTCMGMRLAGVEGVVVHEAQEVMQTLSRCMEDKSIGIVLVTEKLMLLCMESISQIKLSRKRPLIVEIPDRHGGNHIATALEQYVNEAIGLKM